MKMRTYNYLKLSAACCLGFLFMTSCNKDSISPEQEFGKTEILVEAVIGDIKTKLDDKSNKGSDGRRTFIPGDRFLITKIFRTDNPLTIFTYANVDFLCNAEGGFERQDATSRIFWTDAKEHTFIAYSIPQFEGYSFVADAAGIFKGKLAKEQTDSVKFKGADLLLSYSNSIKADLKEDMVAAKLLFNHALCKVKVVLNIKGFANNSTAYDVATDAENITLSDQPVNFVWKQESSKVELADDPGSETIKMWKAGSSGTNDEKIVTAYALVLPGQRSFTVSMQVTYPDAMSTADGTVTRTYNAKFNDVLFKCGERTTLNITLNHENEDILVKAEYFDWKDVTSLSESDLRKKSIYLTSTDMSSIKLGTAAGNDDKDLADWLYTDGTVVKDVYGGDGTASNPYHIKSAFDLLCLAAESEAGNNFAGKYVLLTTDIYLQKNTTDNSLVWPGIKNFNGTFNGNGSDILSVNGSPIFLNLGSDAVIEYLNVYTGDSRNANEGKISSSSAQVGGICAENNGTIKGCIVMGTIESTLSCGGITANNKPGAKIIGCYHQGAVINTTGSTGFSIGGVAGINDGDIIACYQADGVVESKAAGNSNYVGGIVGLLSGTGKISYSFYETTTAKIAYAVGNLATGGIYAESDLTYKGYTFDQMQDINFYQKLNAASCGVQFDQNPSSFPMIKF